MTGLGDGSWRPAGQLEPATLVLVRDTVGGVTFAGPDDKAARWGTVASVDHRVCDDEPCVRVAVDRDGPGCWLHVTASHDVWTTEPW